ncbi:MAG: CRISPR-associated endonuclease Cas1 [Bryobacteraceae bacterium]
MEELRPVIADRLVLTLINRRQVSAEGFQRVETGGVVMNDATRRRCWWPIRSASRKRWCTRSCRRRSLRHGAFVQATLLARHLRGDLESYPSFLWK